VLAALRVFLTRPIMDGVSGMASRKAYTIGFLFVAVIVAGAYSYEQYGRYWIYDFMQWECVDCKVKDSLDQALNKPWTDDLLGQD
jgi:hypothetical protein